MALIEVNHQVLRETASAITDCCAKQDTELRGAKSEVSAMLSGGWQGADAGEFDRRWRGVDAADSTAVKFRESLKKFGEGLAACANEYQSAQADVYDAASWLPKWLVW